MNNVEVKEDYENADEFVKVSMESDYNLCGGGGSINFDDVKAGKIIVNRGNDYIDECKNEPLTISKGVDRLKVSEVDGKCEKLADKYLDTYKIDNENTRLFIKMKITITEYLVL